MVQSGATVAEKKVRDNLRAQASRISSITHIKMKKQLAVEVAAGESFCFYSAPTQRPLRLNGFISRKLNGLDKESVQAPACLAYWLLSHFINQRSSFIMRPRFLPSG